MSRRRELGKVLLACLGQADGSPGHRDAGNLADPGDRSELLGLARYHRVVPFLYLHLREAGADPALLGALEEEYVHNTARHMRAMADLTTFCDALDGHGITWMVVKGPVLSEVLYPRPDLRMYRDLDILVPEREFERTIDVLEASGFDLLDQNWTLIRMERRGQLHPLLRLGTAVDVHWHLLNREIVRRSLSIPMEEVFDRARTVTLSGLDVLTLDPVDTLVHLCVHAGLSGGDRLVWLKDVERAVVADRPPWDAVIERARRWGAGPLVGIVLDRAALVLHVPVPAEVVRGLLPPFRRGVTLLSNRLWPVERAWGRLTPSVLWTQAARPTWRGTLGALFRRASRRPLRYLGAGKPPEEGRRGTPGSILSPSGGPEDRRRFMESLGESTGRPGRDETPS